MSGARLHGDNEPPRKPPVVVQESEPTYTALATFELQYQKSVRSVHHQWNKQEHQADWSSIMAHALDYLSKDDGYSAMEDSTAEAYRLANGMTMEETLAASWRKMVMSFPYSLLNHSRRSLILITLAP